ncbi:helix-turn-helix domain-containing protein [Clostridium luticellarii]|uniref:HTH-type transcriptional regulator Xre n=1 Tax=Clostridium luticellarii TaxID=1691940 RepID=A0A2T0BQ96_9CLOT|nr:helix-turn-helix domain-containing protein [Clostridium luticellarii]PRR86012.1 HTH-type transcriptional regulator Xre [Clostridium luticellarii]
MDIKISTILKELRYEKDVKQEDVAKAIGISKSGYGYYEQGRSMPDPEMLLKLAKYFNVSADYLLGNTDIKEPIDVPQEYTDKYKVTKRDIKQHDEVIKHAQAFMMDDKVGEKDKEKLVAVINKIYWDSKAKNKEKFGRKKKK